MSSGICAADHKLAHVLSTECAEGFLGTYLRRFVADFLDVVLAKVPLLLVVGHHEGLHGHQL